MNYIQRFRVAPGTGVRLEDIDPTFKARDHLQDLPEIAHWKWTDDLSDPYAPVVAQGPSKSVFTDA